jgi:hypothetical protein
MLKIIFVLLYLSLSLVGLAQTSSDGSFSVHHSKKENFSLSAAQMGDAESIYHNACIVVQHDFQSGAGELHPHFTVIIGAERNEIHLRHPEGEIWMKKWNPMLFAQGVVVLAFDRSLMPDVVEQMANRAIRYANATVDVSRLR